MCDARTYVLYTMVVKVMSGSQHAELETSMLTIKMCIMDEVLDFMPLSTLCHLTTLKYIEVRTYIHILYLFINQ